MIIAIPLYQRDTRTHAHSTAQYRTY